MSGHRVVRVGRAPCLCTELSSPQPHHFQPKALQGLRRGGVPCVAYSTLVEFECEGVPLCLVPPRGAGRTGSRARVPVERTLAELGTTCDRSCSRMQNVKPALGPPPFRPPFEPLVLDKIDFLARLGPAAGIFGDGDRRVVLSPRNATRLIPLVVISLSQRLSHACLDFGLGRPVPPRCAPVASSPSTGDALLGLNRPGRAFGAVTLKKLECSKQAYAPDTLAWDNIIGFRSYSRWPSGSE
ncbi:hypothetical protein OIU74_026170 [Salix koriyanagi]|uniref:Uncharacterized protein n=1 Tax=Salix koriyanagi TaxID=2511006 RepID=A0A9Q1A3I1_9ROSI|nr:hypothetical protein OIU74_026170 [Salix koriyanagi]